MPTAVEVPSEWHASFVAGPQSHGEQPGPAPYFRREFEVGAGLRQARLHVTALGVVDVSLNGAPVGDEVLCPGWTSYRHRIIVSSHDVTSSVAEGRNAVGAVVGEGWAVGRIGFAGTRALWSDRPAAFVELELDYGDRIELRVQRRALADLDRGVARGRHLRRRDLRRPARARRLGFPGLRRHADGSPCSWSSGTSAP